MGVISFYGVDNTNGFNQSAVISAQQSGTAGAFVPTALSLYTTSAIGVNYNQLVLNPDGSVSHSGNNQQPI